MPLLFCRRLYTSYMWGPPWKWDGAFQSQLKLHILYLIYQGKSTKKKKWERRLLFWISSATLSKACQVNYQTEELITHGCNWSAVESGQIRRAWHHRTGGDASHVMMFLPPWHCQTNRQGIGVDDQDTHGTCPCLTLSDVFSKKASVINKRFVFFFFNLLTVTVILPNGSREPWSVWLPSSQFWFVW